MSPTKHTIASGVVSTAFYFATHSWEGTLACFLSGIFIDLDHIVDFWIAKNRFPFRYKDLYSFCAFEKSGKLYLIFHSWELLGILWLIGISFKMDPIILGVNAGMTTHMIFDAFTNSMKPFAYFFVYRIKHDFSKEAAFPEEDYKKLI